MQFSRLQNDNASNFSIVNYCLFHSSSNGKKQMTMTRKDYVETAEILNKFSNLIDSITFQDLVFEFSEFFSANSSRFDEDRFWNACIKTEELV